MQSHACMACVRSIIPLWNCSCSIFAVYFSCVQAEGPQAYIARELWESTSASCCAAGRASAAVHRRSLYEPAEMDFLTYWNMQGRCRRGSACRNAREAPGIELFLGTT